MKTYKWLRGILKASAFATVMFVMQACYGAPHDLNFEDDEYYQLNDTVQVVDQDIVGESEVQ